MSSSGATIASAAPSRFGGALTVDLDAIVRNYQLLRTVSGGARVAAVVKADAYGLGAGAVAPALYAAGCRIFFVAQIDEGVILRAIVRADAEIIVLNGVPPGAEALCAAERLTPVLNGWEQLAAWAAYTAARHLTVRCILQFDTGMARFGFPLGDAAQVRDRIDAAPNLEVALVMSHLACANDPTNAVNGAQLANFETLRSVFPDAAFSLAASSGIFLGAAYHFDMVRPGAALYGVTPILGVPNPMAPVIQVRGQVVQLREVPAGTGIGYGHLAYAQGASRLATIAVGYADGFLRSASNRGAAWLGTIRLPVVGCVSMDSIIVDVSHVAPGAIVHGQFLDLICDHYGVDAAAADAGTNGYEILTSLGHRYHRHYRGDWMVSSGADAGPHDETAPILREGARHF